MRIGKWRCKCDAWGWVALIFAMFAVTRGVLYILKPNGSGTFVLDQIKSVVPLWVYGILWVTAGLWAIQSVLRGHRARLGLLAVTGMFWFWGTFYLITALTGQIDQVVSAYLFIGLGTVTALLPRLVAIPKLYRKRGTS